VNLSAQDIFNAGLGGRGHCKVSPSQPRPAVIHKTSSSVAALMGANAMPRSGRIITCLDS
jgi:hypothetical protein